MNVCDLDLESYSEAGYVWDDLAKKWIGPSTAPKNRKGLGAVGANVYWEHPTADVLTISYDLNDGLGMRRCRPGVGDPPYDLFSHIMGDGIIVAHNNMFERLAFHHCLVPKYGYPAIKDENWRCTAAQARVNNLPGGLDNLGKTLNLDVLKDPEGKKLMDLFSMPRKPTKKLPQTRIFPDEMPVEFERYQLYGDTDVIVAQKAKTHPNNPPMTPMELQAWQLDQAINWRGIAVDRDGIEDCLEIIRQAQDRYRPELQRITGGLDPTQVEALRQWINMRIDATNKQTPTGKFLDDEIPF